MLELNADFQTRGALPACQCPAKGLKSPTKATAELQQVVHQQFASSCHQLDTLNANKTIAERNEDLGYTTTYTSNVKNKGNLLVA